MKKILYAEDTEDIRSVTSRFLKRWGFTEENGYKVLICKSGQDAENIYFSEKPIRAAILDNTMPPGKTGLEIAKMIKHDDPDVKTCLATGDRSIEKEEYVDDLLEKPFSLNESLLPVLKKYLEAE